MKTSGLVFLLLWASLDVVAGDSNDLLDQTTSDTSTQEACQSDIHIVLRRMIAEQTAEQKMELRYAKEQIKALDARLIASEKTVEKLRETEKQVEQLTSDNEAQAVNLSLALSQVEELMREKEKSRVAFSASLVTSGGGYTGPYSVDTPLIFKHVFVNIGNGYNSTTGVFTAPVRGVYHFVLFLHGYAPYRAAVSLRKNGHHVVSPYSSVSSGNATPANGASVLLEVGDVVSVILWIHSQVFDNIGHHNSFSGHLLFPMYRDLRVSHETNQIKNVLIITSQKLIDLSDVW